MLLKQVINQIKEILKDITEKAAQEVKKSPADPYNSFWHGKAETAKDLLAILNQLPKPPESIVGHSKEQKVVLAAAELYVESPTTTNLGRLCNAVLDLPMRQWPENTCAPKPKRKEEQVRTDY